MQTKAIPVTTEIYIHQLITEIFTNPRSINQSSVKSFRHLSTKKDKAYQEKLFHVMAEKLIKKHPSLSEHLLQILIYNWLYQLEHCSHLLTNDNPETSEIIEQTLLRLNFDAEWLNRLDNLALTDSAITHFLDDLKEKLFALQFFQSDRSQMHLLLDFFYEPIKNNPNFNPPNENILLKMHYMYNVCIDKESYYKEKYDNYLIFVNQTEDSKSSQYLDHSGAVENLTIIQLLYDVVLRHAAKFYSAQQSQEEKDAENHASQLLEKYIDKKMPKHQCENLKKIIKKSIFSETTRKDGTKLFIACSINPQASKKDRELKQKEFSDLLMQIDNIASEQKKYIQIYEKNEQLLIKKKNKILSSLKQQKKLLQTVQKINNLAKVLDEDVETQDKAGIVRKLAENLEQTINNYYKDVIQKKSTQEFKKELLSIVDNTCQDTTICRHRRKAWKYFGLALKYLLSIALVGTPLLYNKWRYNTFFFSTNTRTYNKLHDIEEEFEEDFKLISTSPAA